MTIKLGSIAFALACLALGGCATSRSEIKLNSPPIASAPASGAVKGAVFIRSVTDKRVFEVAPSEPSTPSLGFEGAAQATAETKARAIGRKRNSYGKALGDVLLEDGQTVTGVVRDNIAAAFAQAGYRVETDPMAASVPMVLDVEIKKFWAWFQPGFWAITLTSEIEADVKLAGAAKVNTLTVRAEDKRQAATDSAWMEIVDQALADLRTQVATNALAK
jgi:hypothetical protein